MLFVCEEAAYLFRKENRRKGCVTVEDESAFIIGCEKCSTSNKNPGSNESAGTG